MGCLMNVLWLLFGGILTAIEYVVASLLLMVTIVGIPFGIQTLKMASLALWPFGKEVRSGIIGDDCIACGTCIDECPSGAISEGEKYSINPDLCTECGTCADVCPNEAISLP